MEPATEINEAKILENDESAQKTLMSSIADEIIETAEIDSECPIPPSKENIESNDINMNEFEIIEFNSYSDFNDQTNKSQLISTNDELFEQTQNESHEISNESSNMQIVFEDVELTKSQLNPTEQSKSAIQNQFFDFDFNLLKNKIQKSYKQISISRKMKKYYNRRYMLFSLFDNGILMDEESWYSVTPEKTAEHIARKCYEKLGYDSNKVVLDPFCGSGGNTIQFAKYFKNVVACDIDFIKLQCAQHNATEVYNVGDRVRFIMQDFFHLHETLNLDDENSKLKIDLIFLSPPWGGVNYFHSRQVDISEFPLDAFKIYLYCINKLKCKNIVYFLPRNSNLEQVLFMAGPGGHVELEQNFIEHKLVAMTAYYGQMCDKSSFDSM